jgi:hypothetical protein
VNELVELGGRRIHKASGDGRLRVAPGSFFDRLAERLGHETVTAVLTPASIRSTAISVMRSVAENTS